LRKSLEEDKFPKKENANCIACPFVGVCGDETL